ncbi:hypothetical protein D1872_287940 [compost metagenome]
MRPDRDAVFVFGGQHHDAVLVGQNKQLFVLDQLADEVIKALVGVQLQRGIALGVAKFIAHWSSLSFNKGRHVHILLAPCPARVLSRSCFGYLSPAPGSPG